jgi:hypothetical protein
MSTRHSTRNTKAPERLIEIQSSLSKGKYHGHVDTYDRKLIQQEVSAYLLYPKEEKFHGYSGKDGFVVGDEDLEIEVAEEDEELVQSDDEETDNEEEPDLESDSDEEEDEDDNE